MGYWSQWDAEEIDDLHGADFERDDPEIEYDEE